MSEEKINFKYKDSLFVSIFGRCIDAKKNFLSLYNAIQGTNLKIGEVKIEPVMLENVVYNGHHNDVSMMIDGKVIVMAEHQSTVNDNMPLRCLEYVTRSLEKLFPERNKYRTAQIKLPSPEFYVFYNGEENFPKEKTLKLSDSFSGIEGTKQLSGLELIVKVYNIKYPENHEFLQKCNALMGYSKFVYYATEARKNGIKDYIGHAIDRCQREEIMIDYFQSLHREDKNMIFGDWDWDIAKEVWQEEAENKKAVEDSVVTIRELNVPKELVFEKMKLTQDQIEQVEKVLSEKAL